MYRAPEPAGGPPLGRVRVLPLIRADGARQMALDSWMLAAAASGEVTLRCYEFARSCVSLGRFQRTDGLDRRAADHGCLEVVRRPTGGRAVLHDGTLTYAIALPGAHPWAQGPVRAVAGRLAGAVLAALQRVGVPPPDDGPAGGRAAADCFAVAAPYEATWDGAKLMGAAQVRADGGVLQHGAIRLQAPVHHGRTNSGLGGLWPDEPLAPSTTVSDAVGRPIDAPTLARAILESFEEHGAELRRRALEPDEERAWQARVARFRDPGWTWAR